MSTTSGSRDYGRFDELAEEFAGRYRRGERPSLQEYVDRLPEMAEEIREMFPAMVEVERADGEVRGEKVLPSPPPVAPHLRQIGDYRILREVGRGGMGVVYEAEQVSLGRRVALKVLPGHVTADRRALERFRREAKSAARLHHTNIVPVFEVGRDRDVSFYAMQLIQGQGLDQVFEELRRLREPGRKANGHEPAPPGDPVVGTVDLPRVTATSILRERALVQMTERLLTGRLAVGGPDEFGGGAKVAIGLAQTEQFDPDSSSGLTSDVPGRELPPAPIASSGSSSAVMPGGKHVSEVDTSGRRQPFFRSVAQIGRQTAQGLAYAHARGIVHRDIKPSNLLLDTEGVVWITDFGLAKADDDGMTASGDILGTLRYMSPERFRGEGDARADIYALGLTLYELLTLRPAYDSTDRLRLIEKIKNEEPPRPRSIDPQIPRDLETIVLKAIDKHPDHRYPTAAVLAEDLRRFLADEPIKARQISTSERYWRWARRNPVVATLGGVLTALLVTATIASLLTAAHLSAVAESERTARKRSDDMTSVAERARAEAEKDRAGAERAREAESREKNRAEGALLDSLDQTYRATRSEVRAMRLAHESGWRSGALERLGGLVRLGSRNLDRRELREDAIACLAEVDVRVQSKFAPPRDLGVWHLRFSPDGRTLAVNDKTRSVALWDLVHDRDLAPIPKALELSPFAFHPGGALAVASAPGRVTFHPLAPGQPTFPAIEGQGQALNLAFSRTGDRLAVAWEEVFLPGNGAPRELRRIAVYETATGKEIRTIAIPKGSLINYKVPLALSPDGDSVATTGPNFEVRVYPVGDSGDPVVLGTLETFVCTIAFHPDGRSLAACGKRFVAIWDLASRSERVRIINPSERGIWDLAFSPDGRYLATASDDAVGRLWDARSGRELAAVPAQTRLGLSVAFSPLGDRFAVGAASVSVLAIEGGRERRTEPSQTNVSHDLVFDPAQPLLFHCGGDRNLHGWNLDEPAARPIYRLMGELNPFVLRLAPGGREFVVGWHPYTGTKPGGDYSLRVWARDDPSAQRRLVGPRGRVDSIALDETGRRIAAGSRDDGLYVWDFRGGTLLHRKELGAMAPSLHFLDDPGLLVAAGRRLLLLSAEDGAVRRELTLPQGVTYFVVTPDRKQALVATTDGAVHRVLLPGLEIKRSRMALDPAPELRMAISPEGSLLAVTMRNRARALLLDPETLEPIAMMPGHDSGRLEFLVFDPKGRYLAFGDSDIALWDLALVRDELAPLGLGWGHVASPTISTPDPAALADLVKEAKRDRLAEAERKARGFLQSGHSAFQEKRFLDAAVNLQRASEQFGALRTSRPNNQSFVRLHATSLALLACCLRDLKRPGESLPRFRESLALYESLGDPNPGDL